MLPNDWRDRLVRIESARTRGAVGLRLEIHGLLISTYVAGRERDLEFVRAVTRHGMVSQDELRHRLEATPISAGRKTAIASFISRDF